MSANKRDHAPLLLYKKCEERDPVLKGLNKMLIIFLFELAYSELQAHYPNLATLRTLISGIPIPREGEDTEEILLTLAPSPLPSEPAIPPHRQPLLAILSRLHGEGIISITFFYKENLFTNK